MTILDKEEETKTHKKRKTKKIEKQPTKKLKKQKKQHLLFYKLLSFLFIVLSVFTLGYIIYKDIFSIFYTIGIGIIGLLIITPITLILNKDKLRAWIKNIVSFITIIAIIFEILMILFGTDTLKFLSSVTDTGYRVETYGVYVLKSKNYKELNDLTNKQISYLNTEDDKNIREAISKLKKEVSFDDDYYDTINELLTSLEEDSDAIVFEQSYEQLISEEYPEVYQKIKMIDSVDIVDMVTTIESDVDITKDPFVIYISGIDTSGNVASKARSDVNIILSINPTTGQILMVNTPRDYYVTLATYNQKDKLTHAGLYGVEESVKTLSKLYDVDIDYYLRINFTSFMKIVDALGGVNVDVKYAFCEQDSHRNFDNQICLKKGMQTLNGEKALALARHRHTLPAGDKTRGENQMQLIEAIVDKALSPAILTKYSSLISALNGRISTNMSTNEMYKFAKKQINKKQTWTFTSMSADGSNSSNKAYSTGNSKVYVMEPNEDTVESIKKSIDNLFNGETDILYTTTEQTTNTTKKVTN